MSANHQLHYTPGSEGYGTWRLECLPGTDNHGIFLERTWPDAITCRCTEAGEDCESCRKGEHDACSTFGQYIGDIDYECRCDYDPNRCWTIDWFDEYGADCIWGDDWPEDGPWTCIASGGEGLELHYEAEPPHLPTTAQMERDAKADDEFRDAMDS